MAANSIKANYIFNGEDYAYILNALKIENGKLILYNEKNPAMTSSVNLPTYDIESIEPVTNIYNVDTYITTEAQKNDSTTIINSLITTANANGGGVLKFGSGVYNVGSITLKPKVHLVGSGVGATIIKRANNDSYLESETDSIHSCHGFINVPNDAYGCSITDLSLYSGATYTPNGNKLMGLTYLSKKINGIAINDNTINSLNSSGAAADAFDALTSTNSLTDGGNRNQKFLTIRNVSIFGFFGSGIYVGTYNSDVTIDNVLISHCRRDGITSQGNGNFFSNINIFGTGECGIRDAGSNNKYNNIEIDYCGSFSHTGAYGVRLETQRDTLSNIICKYCYSAHYYIAGQYNCLSNCISDSAGGASKNDSGFSADNFTVKDVPHVKLAGKYHRIDISIFNSRFSSYQQIASYPVITESNISNCMLNIVCEGKDAVTDKKKYAVNDSKINNVNITSMNNSQIIVGDNILTYIP